ncbi:MAG: CtsR family transcriptional regulator [Clostridia bacterium]|nr:CtsR family transcriptional regulator [Clostridia bacterium]
MLGISDVIEQFLHKMMQESDGTLEIQRKTIADQFGCVPSQINYVIRTRFTCERGYVVESKRGGGGYLRISRVAPQKQNNYFMHVVNAIGSSISFQTATVFVKNMVDNEYLTPREGKIILSGLGDNKLPLPLPMRDTVRATLLKNMLISTMM